MPIAATSYGSIETTSVKAAKNTTPQAIAIMIR